MAGETLEARVRRAGPLPVPEALEVVAQVTRALALPKCRGWCTVISSRRT